MWLLDEWQPLAADKMERLGKKGWEIKRSKGGGKAEGRWGEGLCNRWSECSLTAGEYARLPQSDKWLSRSQDSRTGKKNGRKDGIHLQSSGDGEKTFVFEEREREKHSHGEKHQVFTQHESTRETVLNTSTRGYETEKTRREGERGKKTKTNKQSLWPKAALSALVFILGSLLSVWRDELFMAQECVGTTVQLLMKQSSGAARLGNHRHNVAGE